MIESAGAALAETLRRELRPRAARFQELAGRPATLAVVAARDEVQARFVGIKQEAFRAASMELRPAWLQPDSDTPEALAQVHRLNGDSAVDAVFLQFPLPAGIDGQRVGDIIDPGKDIDAAGSANLGRVLAGTQAYLPAAPAAMLRLLEHTLGELAGRSVLLIGADGLAERCLVLLAIARGATVCVLRPQDPAIADAAAGTDALVITDELPPGDALRNVRNGAVLLDAAYFRPPRPSGWLPERAQAHVGTYLPQYRNVGPLTVALLMQSTLRAALLLDT